MHGAELPQNLPQCEVLLHCGNLTEHGTPQSISSALQNLSKVDARLKLVIAGNHEVSLDRQYWLSHGGPEDDVKRAHALVASNGEASQYGTNFLSEGTHTFNLPCGATFKIYASPYTPGNGASALQYPSSKYRSVQSSKCDSIVGRQCWQQYLNHSRRRRHCHDSWTTKVYFG